MKTQHTPGIRYCRKTGQYFPTVDGIDISPTSFSEERALEIAKQSARAAELAPELAEALRDLVAQFNRIRFASANDSLLEHYDVDSESAAQTAEAVLAKLEEEAK